MKYIIKNCPAFCDNTRQCRGAYDRKISHQYCSGNNDTDCIIKQIVELCKDVKGKDPIVAERDKQTGEIISISGWSENPVYDFAQKILQVLEIEEVDE